MGSHPTPLRAARFALMVVVFLSLNSSLNLLNRWSLGVYGFRFPFLLTSCHMAFSFLVLAPVALQQPWESHRHTLEKQWKGIVYVGSFLALSIALNNTSLLDISLTLNQIIRSSIPVVACILGILVESRYPTRQELVGLVILTFGVMLAVWQGTVSGRPYAIICCLLSTICSGAMLAFSSKVMSEKLDVVRLTFFTAPVSLACLAPFYWTYERERFWAYLPAHTNSVAVIILGSSVIAVCYNLMHNLMIKRASAVTTTVLGEVKIVALLVLSATLLSESKEFTFKMTLGVGLAMLGFALYSHAQILKLRQRVSTPVVAFQDEASNGAEELMPLQARHHAAEHQGSTSSQSAAPLVRSDA